MEYTGVYHLKLTNYLYENSYKVAVVNPFSIKKFMEAKMTRVKTDKADLYYNSRIWKNVFLMESFIKQKQLTMPRNQREALSHVIMKKLKENLEYYDELIRKIEKSIKELEKKIKELSKKNYLQ